MFWTFTLIISLFLNNMHEHLPYFDQVCAFLTSAKVVRTVAVMCNMGRKIRFVSVNGCKPINRIINLWISIMWVLECWAMLIPSLSLCFCRHHSSTKRRGADGSRVPLCHQRAVWVHGLQPQVGFSLFTSIVKIQVYSIQFYLSSI